MTTLIFGQLITHCNGKYRKTDKIPVYTPQQAADLIAAVKTLSSAGFDISIELRTEPTTKPQSKKTIRSATEDTK